MVDKRPAAWHSHPPVNVRLSLAVLLALALGCSGNPGPADSGGGPSGGGARVGCLPGAASPCDCDGGPPGAIVCLDDGGFGACQCPVSSATDGGDAG